MHLAVSMNICIRAHKPHKDISGKSRDHHERTRGTGTGIAIPSGITTSFSFMHVLHLKSAIGSAGFMTPPVTEARCFHMQSLSPSHMEQRVVCPLMASMYSSIYCTSIRSHRVSALYLINPPTTPFLSGEVREQRSPQTLKPAAELLTY